MKVLNDIGDELEQREQEGPRFALDPQVERWGAQIVDSVVYVHEQLGPGLLESVYEICLFKTLQKRGIKVERQVPLPVIFDGETLDADLRLDLLVEGQILLELKAVEQTLPVHQAQVITYLKLSGKKLGFLINFNVKNIRNGIKRIVL